MRRLQLVFLADQRMDQLAGHIENCESCGATVDEFSRQPDSGLVAELRTINVPIELDLKDEESGLTIPEALVEAACAASDESSVSVSFDAGRRIAKRLQDGPCQLGRFELQAELGVGAFGYVFKAYDAELDRFVAVKVQRAGTFATDEDVERFHREAQSIAQLNHPGIVTVYDSVRSEPDVCYLVTEYIDGKSLEARLENEAFSFHESAELVAAIGDALHYAHDNGIVHRDVKPSNVLLDREARPHLSDFGLAKRARDSAKSDHRGWQDHGNARVYVTGTGFRPLATGRCSQRCVQSWSRALRDADGRTPVPGQPSDVAPAGAGR